MSGNLLTVPSKSTTGLRLPSMMLVGGGFVPGRSNCATLGVDCEETANEKKGMPIGTECNLLLNHWILFQGSH